MEKICTVVFNNFISNENHLLKITFSILYLILYYCKIFLFFGQYRIWNSQCQFNFFNKIIIEYFSRYDFKLV